MTALFFFFFPTTLRSEHEKGRKRNMPPRILQESLDAYWSPALKRPATCAGRCRCRVLAVPTWHHRASPPPPVLSLSRAVPPNLSSTSFLSSPLPSSPQPSCVVSSSSLVDCSSVHHPVLPGARRGYRALRPRRERGVREHRSPDHPRRRDDSRGRRWRPCRLVCQAGADGHAVFPGRPRAVEGIPSGRRRRGLDDVMRWW